MNSVRIFGGKAERPDREADWTRATVPPLLRLIDLAELYDVPLDALMRTGSSRSVDQSADIAAALHGLTEENREWVRAWVIDMYKSLQYAVNWKVLSLLSASQSLHVIKKRSMILPE